MTRLGHALVFLWMSTACAAAWGVDLQGRIVDTSGLPIAGASVFVANDLLGEWGSPVLTSEEGTFDILDISPGPSAIRVEAPGHIPDVREVTLSGRGIFGLEIALEPGNILAGSVVDANGHAIAEAEVTSSDGLTQGVITDAHGRFRIDGVPAATSRLRILAMGRPALSFDLRWPPYEGNGSDGNPMESAEALGDLRVVLPEGSTVSGRLDGLSADQLEGTLVQATRLREGKIVMARAQPDADGRYHLAGLEGGEWHILVETRHRRQVESLRLPARPTSLTVDFDFIGGADLRGRLTLLGEPLAEAELTFLPASAEGWLETQTDSEGAFHIESAEAGRGLLRIHSQRHRFSHGVVVDLPSEDLRLDLRPLVLEGSVFEGSVLEGSVFEGSVFEGSVLEDRDVDGALTPVAGIRLRLEPDGEAATVQWAWGETDADGYYRILATFLGPAVLAIDGAKRSAQTWKLDLHTGMDPVDLHLE